MRISQKTRSATIEMKKPTCRPWSVASPQKTGSRALAATSSEIGTLATDDVAEAAER